MKFTEEQKELLALLPTEIKKSDELTDSAKLVLANIYFLYGMDKAKENGFVYKSDGDMAKDCNIHKSTVGLAVRQLETKNYIEVKRGKSGNRGEASEYCLTEKIDTKIDRKCSENYTQKIDTKIDFQVVENELIALKNEVFELKKIVKTLTEKIDTDSDTESDTDKEKDKEYNTSTSTGTENFDDMDNDYVSAFDVDSYDEVKACISFIPSDEVIENNSDELYQDSTGMNKSDTDSDIAVFNDKKGNEMSDDRNECNERNITSLPTAESDNINPSPQPLSPQTLCAYDWRETVHKLNKCREELNQCGTVEDFNVKLEEIWGILEIIKENDDKRSYERNVKNTIAFLNCTNIKNDFIFAAGDYRRKLENNLYKIA